VKRAKFEVNRKWTECARGGPFWYHFLEKWTDSASFFLDTLIFGEILGVGSKTENG
jgi:hypothetical protein